MKLKIRYEDEFQIVVLDAEATEKMWVSLSLEGDDDMTQEEKERRIQEEWDEQFNKPEYNIYHRETRHIGDAVFRNKEGIVEFNTAEALIRKAADDSVFTKELDELEFKMECEYQDKRCRELIRLNLKPAQADMVIAIVLDGYSVSDYAERIGDESNNVSHRYRRAIKKLQKVFYKTSF
ncbi:hypothetical protein [Phocaeicola sartorii]|uniref:hypothetical protein n=1 Tax=Phocaeicola sartorii TaxID=671267 RepID=UPI00258DAA97|nr:hypothetical protein [Phocaeicola sartorii]